MERFRYSENERLAPLYEGMLGVVPSKREGNCIKIIMISKHFSHADVVFGGA